ncbi:MAG: sigma-70 family RNA polymerase sigma factor [Bacteroidia bacterium]|nr:sigma-70 family RNA polymerase sigma factor [Bacteroidia bacterium]NND24703.1 sigma-70 family RNA polymerase sigma factor [Flavobacteriaceae bacterium]MBT8278801.1 sigma-70 family RNA polymerase sigma factor [Bacteroidia bacterium]NNK59045.1 sigma-70 family RNA polymerase sigma factor [Flavobacteriaceae bacterium]NNL33767.1 sigma-70 family RNA polymerase sigma factor [Flavobacteriaceae bacterium]
MTLDTLIVQFQNKNEIAFEQLYNMYAKSIHGIIYSIVRDEEIAEELVTDVFMKAWSNAESYSKEKGRFFTWLLNIARNTAIDKLRSKSFKNKKQNLQADFFVDILESRSNLNRETDSIGLSGFVKHLAKKCRDLIELLYFKGFTQKEASESLDIPIGTIKTRNRNCIIELRNILDV